MSLPTGEQTLLDFVKAVGGTEIEVTGENRVDFTLVAFPALCYIKDGGSRIRGSVFLDEPVDLDVAERWVAAQPPPESGVLEVVTHPEDHAGHSLRILFERPVGSEPLATDTLFQDVLDFGQAWYHKTDVAELGDVEPFAVPGDPVEIKPANAWLLKGTEAAVPSREEVLSDVRRGHVGVFEYLWTTAKQTEVGDLALIYFIAPRKAVHFVTRAASRAFFDSSIEVVADGKVAPEQWWAYFTPLIEIEPIPFQVLQQHHDQHLLLKGKSGHYLRPEVIAALPMRAKHPEEQAALDRVVATPVGRADLPPPREVTMHLWRHVAAGAMGQEAQVSQYVVEPLLRYALRGTGLTWKREFKVGKKYADYVVLDDHGPRCVLEVKLAMREDPTGVWANSPDFAQMRGYADALGCPGILIDASRVVLVPRGGDEPHRIIERRRASAEDLNAIRRHLSS